MKNRSLFAVICTIMLILSGCAVTKPNLERGWIGGEYLEANPSWLKKMTVNYFQRDGEVVPALAKKIAEKQASAVLVSRVFANTPMIKAGIKEGDLIVAVNNRTVEEPADLTELTSALKPGETAAFTLFREGVQKEVAVKVGKETYQNWQYINLGLRLGTKCDLIPHPDFNLLGLISFRRNTTRLELNSPEYLYYLQALELVPGTTDRNPESVADAEGWEAWFVFFGFAGKKIIISQQG